MANNDPAFLKALPDYLRRRFPAGGFGIVDKKIRDGFDLLVEGMSILEGMSGGLLPPAMVDGAVIIEDGTGGARIVRRLRQSDIDPDFAINNFSVSGASLVETRAPYDNPTFTAGYNIPTGDLTQADVQDNQGGGIVDVLTTPTGFTYTGSYGGASGPLATPNATVQWTLTAAEGAASDTNNTSVQSATRSYFGAAAIPGVVDEAFIEGLASSQLKTNRNLTTTLNLGASEYGWYALPQRLGVPKLFLNSSALENLTVFEGTVSVTNAFGHTEDYDVYRNVNPNLGSTLFEWRS